MEVERKFLVDPTYAYLHLLQKVSQGDLTAVRIRQVYIDKFWSRADAVAPGFPSERKCFVDAIINAKEELCLQIGYKDFRVPMPGIRNVLARGALPADWELRFRESSPISPKGGSPVETVTIKSPKINGVCHEFEAPAPQVEGGLVSALTNTPPIDKIRIVTSGDQCVEYDIFMSGRLRGLCMAEVEYPTAKAKKRDESLPPGAIVEVTGKHQFSNAALAYASGIPSLFVGMQKFEPYIDLARMTMATVDVMGYARSLGKLAERDVDPMLLMIIKGAGKRCEYAIAGDDTDIDNLSSMVATAI